MLLNQDLVEAGTNPTLANYPVYSRAGPHSRVQPCTVTLGQRAYPQRIRHDIARLRVYPTGARYEFPSPMSNRACEAQLGGWGHQEPRHTKSSRSSGLNIPTMDILRRVFAVLDKSQWSNESQRRRTRSKFLRLRLAKAL